MMSSMIAQIITIPLFLLHFSSWTPLFNGENLEGWSIVNGDESTWVAKDNKIVTTGKPTGVLRTNKMYENFILELDWRHLEPNGNAGLFVWSDPIPAKGVPFTRSIEVQIMDGKELDWYTTHGDIFSIWGASMVPNDPHPMGEKVQRCLPSERRSNPAPEWNHYVITCIDGQINLSVNGAFVSGAHDVSPRKGYLCLEAEGTEAEFKNIRILELPPSAPAIGDPYVASEDRGFKTLFTGINLDGWNTSDASLWRAQDNVLECYEGSDTLETTTTHGTYEIMLDYLCSNDESSVYIVINGKKSELPCEAIGQWTRFFLKGSGGELGIGGSNAKFTNLFIRPTKITEIIENNTQLLACLQSRHVFITNSNNRRSQHFFKRRDCDVTCSTTN